MERRKREERKNDERRGGGSKHRSFWAKPWLELREGRREGETKVLSLAIRTYVAVIVTFTYEYGRA